jgi:uncharacterized membrane protein
MHRTEIESVRAHITHVKEQVGHVRTELETSGEALAAEERAELDSALVEAAQADRELTALEDLEAVEAKGRDYRPDPGAALMAKFFLLLFGFFVATVFISKYVG